MIVQIFTLHVVGAPTSTESTFLPWDLTRIREQPGADGQALLAFKEDGKIYHAVIGMNGTTRMDEPYHYAAKPCPPFCPIKYTAFAVDDEV